MELELVEDTKTCKGRGNNYNQDSGEMIEISDMVLFLFYLII